MALLSRHHLHVETNGSRSRVPRGPYSSEAAFDTNMVIILAALLCALILALGLNSIMRCAMRCSRTLSFNNNSSSTSVRMMASQGLKKNALRRIPVAVYHPELDIPATDCPICLAEFCDGERVRVLPRCQHGFHVTCIDMWLVSHSSCPTCRQSLLDHRQLVVSSEAAPGFHGETTIIVDEVS